MYVCTQLIQTHTLLTHVPTHITDKRNNMLHQMHMFYKIPVYWMNAEVITMQWTLNLFNAKSQGLFWMQRTKTCKT